MSLFLKGRKTTQLRSKTASSSTTQKVEVFLKAKKRLNFAPKLPFSFQHNSVLVVTSQSLRGYFAVTSRLQRGCDAVAMGTTRSLRGHNGHYRSLGYYAVKNTYSRLRTLNFAPKQTLDQNIFAVLILLLLQKDSFYGKSVSSLTQ